MKIIKYQTTEENPMKTENRYEYAKQIYSDIGVDCDKAISILSEIPISIQCWQGDDVTGFDTEGPLTGGIQTTGNYLGKATTPEQLMKDIDKVLSLVPGKHRLNLHSCYAIFEGGEFADRNNLKPEHFKRWVEFAKSRNLGLDFNPTLFSHKMVKNNLTLSSPDKIIRDFWIEHCRACIKIAEYFATELNTYSLINIWIPDGYKDIPADRYSPRLRFKNSLDEILSVDYDKSKVLVSLESKVFGIGIESYTVGSSEFTQNYAASNKILPLMDMGHYHPTETVSDKISSMLLFNEKIALHVSRPVRWDSDHVVLFDDEIKEVAKEIVFSNAIDRILIGLDFFDASINRISAWTVGMRNTQKALLYSLLLPRERMINLQNEHNTTELMMLQEELKTYPFVDVWNYYCEKCGVPIGTDWFKQIKQYENDELINR